MNSKSFKIILIILGIAVLISLGVLYFSKSKPSDVPGTGPGTEEEEEFSYLIDFSNVGNIQEAQLEILKQDYGLAVEEYEKNPNSFSALMTFAFTYYQLGDYEKARDVYIKIGEISSKNYTSFWNLANTYIRLKNYSGAERAYLRTIENGPDQTRHYTALAELYWYNLPEKREQIPELYKKGLEELPGNYDLLVNLAWYYKETGDKKNALKYYQEVIDNYPETEEIIRAAMEEISD